MTRTTSDRDRECLAKLVQVLRDEAGNTGCSDRIEYWAQRLLEDRYAAYWLDHRRHRVVGDKGARDAVTKLKKTAAALRVCIDQLPADAVDALNDTYGSPRFWILSGTPGPAEKKLEYLYDLALPELIADAEKAVNHLISNPTRAEGPRKKGAERVSSTAHSAYMEITGDRPGRGGSEGRKETSPFIRFLGKILEVLEVNAKPAGQARKVIDDFKREARQSDERRKKRRGLNVVK